MKECIKCHKLKPNDEFQDRKDSKDGKRAECKMCRKEYHKKYYQKHREEVKEKVRNHYHNDGGREKQGKKSMYEDKNCPQYLGIVVAERLVKHLFKDVEVMPYGFPDYDMICNKGKKINVKASTIRDAHNKNSTVNRWDFHTNYNKDCDFFLCMAFDNVIDCNPLIAWMIPGSEVNHYSKIIISSTTIHKWDKWKMDMSNAQACCDLMKGKD